MDAGNARSLNALLNGSHAQTSQTRSPFVMPKEGMLAKTSVQAPTELVGTRIIATFAGFALKTVSLEISVQALKVDERCRNLWTCGFDLLRNQATVSLQYYYLFTH